MAKASNMFGLRAILAEEDEFPVTRLSDELEDKMHFALQRIEVKRAEMQAEVQAIEVKGRAVSSVEDFIKTEQAPVVSNYDLYMFRRRQKEVTDE